MPGGDLDIAEVHASIQHGRYEGVAEHVRVRPGDPHASGLSETLQAAGGGVAVHPGTAAVEQDRPAGAGADRAVDGPPDGWRERDQDDLGAFAAHAQHPVAVFFAEVGDVGASGFEDPQAEQAEHGHQRSVSAARAARCPDRRCSHTAVMSAKSIRSITCGSPTSSRDCLSLRTSGVVRCASAGPAERCEGRAHLLPPAMVTALAFVHDERDRSMLLMTEGFSSWLMIPAAPTT